MAKTIPQEHSSISQARELVKSLVDSPRNFDKGVSTIITGLLLYIEAKAEAEVELLRSQHLHDATCFVNINVLKARIKELESNAGH